MINRYALAFTVPAVMLSSSLASPAVASPTTRTEPVLFPNASLGNEQSKEPNSYFAVPPGDSVHVVRSGVDRAGWIPGLQSPTDYPQERHSVYVPSQDTYFAFYEWNDENDMAVTGKYWDEVLGFGFWSAEGTVNEPDIQNDGGRPSGHELDGGIMVAYHAHIDGDTDPNHYNVWINTFDFASEEWGTSLQVTDDPVGSTFPFLDQSSDGKWMIVSQEGATGVNVVANISDDDGATWTQTTVASGVNDMWLLPSGAADPSNGDLYVAYNGDTEGDNLLEAFIHRSTDGGASWSPAQTVAVGGVSKQNVEPSLVVDRNHTVHMVYQENLAPDASGGLSGLQDNGVLIGPAQYVTGHFEADTWVEDSHGPLQDRAALLAVADSCDFEPDSVSIATDSLTGLPQLGIYRGGASDILYVGFISSYMSVTADGGGWMICGPAFQVWMQSNDLGAVGADAGWSERTQVSAISIDDAILDRQPMFVHITHEVPGSGPGYVWSEMFAGAPPSDVMFYRPDIPTGIEGDGIGAPAAPGKVVLHQNAPNPFNPSTSIGFEMAKAGQVELTVYAASGRKVRTLVDGEKAAGRHTVRWNGLADNGSKVSSGVYFYRIEADGVSETRSMLIVK